MITYNISELVPGLDAISVLTAGSSMNATNTVSETPPGTAPGSPSETSSGIPAGEPGPHATASYDTPVLIDPSGARRTADRNTARPPMLRMGGGWAGRTDIP